MTTARLIAQQATERAARNTANLTHYERKVGVPAWPQWPAPMSPLEIRLYLQAHPHACPRTTKGSTT